MNRIVQIIRGLFRVVVAILGWSARGLRLDVVYNYVRGPGYQLYRTGAMALLWVAGLWLVYSTTAFLICAFMRPSAWHALVLFPPVITLALLGIICIYVYVANAWLRWASIILVSSCAAVVLLVFLIMARHNPAIVFTCLGLINALVSGVILIYAVPAATYIGLILSLGSVADLGTWGFTRIPPTLIKHTTANVRAYLHAVGWVLVAELLGGVYHQLFPVWRNPGLFPLLISAIAVVAILSRQTMAGERKLNSAAFRSLINTVMYGVIAVCSVALLLPGPFAKIVGLFNQLDGILSQGRWIPLAILVFLGAIALATGKCSGSDGKCSNSWTYIPLICLTYLYLGFIFIELGVIRWNFPRVQASWVLGAALAAMMACIGQFFEKGDGKWKRAWYGVGVLSAIIAPLLMGWYENSQAGRLYDPHVNAKIETTYAGTRHATPTKPLALVRVCNNKECVRYLKDAYRGAKASEYYYCEACGSPMKWNNELAPDERKLFERNPKYHDVEKVSLAAAQGRRRIVGGDLDAILSGRGGR